MRKSLSQLFQRMGGAVTYGFLLLFRSPVDTVLCIINALFLRNVFQTIEAGDERGLWCTCVMFGVANLCLFLYNGTLWGKFAVFSAKLVGKLKNHRMGLGATAGAALVHALQLKGAQGVVAVAPILLHRADGV